jgi:hypothetical protein
VCCISAEIVTLNVKFVRVELTFVNGFENFDRKLEVCYTLHYDEPRIKKRGNLKLPCEFDGGADV